MTELTDPGFLAEVSWADVSCRNIGEPFFDLSILPIEWDDPGRTEPLLWLIREFGARGSTWDSVMDGGGQDKLRDYAQSSER